MLPASTAKAEAARAASLHGAEAEACPGTLLPPQPPPAWPGPLSFAPWPCVCTLVHPAGSCHLQPASQCMRKLRGSWPWPRAVLQPVPHHSSMCPLPHGPAWGHTSAGVQAAVSQTTLVVAVHLGALGWWRAPWRRGARGAALLQTSCGPGLKLNACPLTPLCGGMMFALHGEVLEGHWLGWRQCSFRGQLWGGPLGAEAPAVLPCFKPPVGQDLS